MTEVPRTQGEWTLEGPVSCKHMSADIYFKASYVVALIGYGVLTYLSIFHDFP